jgi:hypothetical protein
MIIQVCSIYACPVLWSAWSSCAPASSSSGPDWQRSRCRPSSWSVSYSYSQVRITFTVFLMKWYITYITCIVPLGSDNMITWYLFILSGKKNLYWLLSYWKQDTYAYRRVRMTCIGWLGMTAQCLFILSGKHNFYWVVRYWKHNTYSYFWVRIG